MGMGFLILFSIIAITVWLTNIIVLLSRKRFLFLLSHLAAAAALFIILLLVFPADGSISENLENGAAIVFVPAAYGVALLINILKVKKT